jgi:Spy/CpxP family protein refolding chaperone
MGEGREFRGLNLTEAQQTKLKAVHEGHRATFKAKQEAAGAAHMALREAMDSDATDAKALRSLHDKASVAQFDLLLEHRALRQETLALLTPEQRAKLPKGGMGMGREGHGMGPGSGRGMDADCPGR